VVELSHHWYNNYPGHILLPLDKSGIKVVLYKTELPSKDVLHKQLEKSLEEARLKAGRCGAGV
jgi:hypothetical protein